MFAYFETTDRLKMYKDNTLGAISLDENVKLWAENNGINYNIPKIRFITLDHLDTRLSMTGSHPMIGYRLIESDAVLFKLEFMLAKFEKIGSREYDEIDYIKIKRI